MTKKELAIKLQRISIEALELAVDILKCKKKKYPCIQCKEWYADFIKRLKLKD